MEIVSRRGPPPDVFPAEAVLFRLCSAPKCEADPIDNYLIVFNLVDGPVE